MAKKRLEMGMAPVHSGEFIRTEILDELGLSIAKAAKVPDVRAATLSDLVTKKPRSPRKCRCGLSWPLT